jgi:uncharacterized beta-barrel protein YwiB (DUF1934 family)
MNSKEAKAKYRKKLRDRNLRETTIIVPEKSVEKIRKIAKEFRMHFLEENRRKS